MTDKENQFTAAKNNLKIKQAVAVNLNEYFKPRGIDLTRGDNGM